MIADEAKRTMSAMGQCVDALANAKSFGYRPEFVSATEPVALTVLALLAHGRADAAARPLQWLFEQQRDNGALGTEARMAEPVWPTAWAVMAWMAAARSHPFSTARCLAAAQRGLAALLTVRGEPGKHSRRIIGHDPKLVAWPWVAGTHSWVEPTALAVMALHAAGQSDHPRAREGMRLLLDRQLPDGGCNYGNTTVLGQILRPHLQPSGMAAVALAGARHDSRVGRTLKFLQDHWRDAHTAPSLSWALMGLAAHGHWPDDADDRLNTLVSSPWAARFGAYHWALLALASSRTLNPLWSTPSYAKPGAPPITPTFLPPRHQQAQP